MSRGFLTNARCAFGLLLSLGGAHSAFAQSPDGATFDVVIPAGANFDKAAFRLWLPSGVRDIQGIVVLTPGSNGDGRDAVQDTVWRQFAVRHRLALVASQLTDKPHDQGFIEHYVEVSKGSGRAFLDGLSGLAWRAMVTEQPFQPPR